MVIKQKTHIKYLFAFKPLVNCGTIDLAILTDHNQYIEYTLDFKAKCLTKWVACRIRSLFEPYLIDKNTDIMVNRILDENQPLYQYFMILRQHICFKMGSVDLDKIVNRIHYYYKRKTANKSKFNTVWNKVIESKQCPWITQEIDYALQNKGRTTAIRIKTLRLAMFYIVVKNYLYKMKTRCLQNTNNKTKKCL